MIILHPERTLSMSRVYKASKQRLLDMWSAPEHLNNWWGPVGFSTTTHEFVFRPGGIWRLTMHGPDGTDYPNVLHYHETGPDRITYTHGGGDEPVHFEATIEFEEVSPSETKLTFTMVFPNTEEKIRCVDQYGADKGLMETMGRLAELAEPRS